MVIFNDTTPGRGYPLPNAANKLKDDVARLRGQATAIDADVVALQAGLAGKADADHDHAIGDVTGLQGVLDGKQAVGTFGSLDDLSDVSVTGAANGQVLIRQSDTWIPVLLQVGNVTNLEALLGGKASTADLSAKADAAAVTAALADKAPTSYVDGLINTLKGGVASTYDTLAKLAAGLADRVSFSAQTPTAPQKAQALSNLGVSAFMQGALDESNGTALWSAIGGTQSLAANGYVKLPNGIIIQWGTLSVTGGGVTLNYPVAFPSNCRAIVGNVMAALDFSILFADIGSANCSARTFNQAGASAGATVCWIAIGY